MTGNGDHRHRQLSSAVKCEGKLPRRSQKVRVGESRERCTVECSEKAKCARHFFGGSGLMERD